MGMLFKESLESLSETPLRVQKTLNDIKMLNHEGKDHINKINEILENTENLKNKDNNKENSDKNYSQEKNSALNLISPLLHLQSTDEKILASLNTLKNVLDSQLGVIDQESSNFMEIISKNTLKKKTSKITENIKRKENQVCFCKNKSKKNLIYCDSNFCEIGW